MSVFKSDIEYITLRKFVGINPWQDAGYMGQGIRIFCDDVGGSHVEHVADILQTILPNAELFTGRIRYVLQCGAVINSIVRCDTTGEELIFDDFITKYNIRLINNSTTGTLGDIITPIGEFMNHRIRHYNLIMTGSAGNGYGQPINTSYYGAAILVTSVHVNENGRIVPAKCAEGQGIDFSMFYGPMPGTSYSAPFLLGMIGLLLGKYPDMNQETVYSYLKDHCITLGKKEVFGWGLPVLESPN